MNSSYLRAIVIAIGTLVGAAEAAQVTVSGTHNVATTGTTGPLGINQVAGINFQAGTGDNSVVGTVNASNIVSGNAQVLTLTLTRFEWRATSNTNITLSVNIVQDYTVNSGFATGSHQLNGNANFSQAGQLARVRSESMHESQQLPTIEYNPTGALSGGAGSTLLNVGQGATTNITVAGVYRIVTTYTFTINAQSGLVSIVLPDSGVDNATLLLVPLPTSAWGSIAGFGLLGAGAWIRRRNHAVIS